jgi:hypothetical protein
MKRKFVVNLKSPDVVSSATFNVADFIAPYIDIRKRYRMLVRSFTTSGNQSGDHSVLVHAPFFRQDGQLDVAIDNVGNVAKYQSDVVLVVQSGYNGSALTYTDVGATEGYHGSIVNSTSWTIYLTELDFITPYTTHNGSHFYIRLEFEEID